MKIVKFRNSLKYELSSCIICDNKCCILSPPIFCSILFVIIFAIGMFQEIVISSNT